MTDLNDTDVLGRGRMTTQAKRIALLERDRAQQSRVLTALVDASKSFTKEQLDQLQTAMREELADAGPRPDGADQQNETRRDFMFLRWLRTGVNGTAAKIRCPVIVAFCGGIVWVVNAGLNAWRRCEPAAHPHPSQERKEPKTLVFRCFYAVWLLSQAPVRPPHTALSDGAFFCISAAGR